MVERWSSSRRSGLSTRKRFSKSHCSPSNVTSIPSHDLRRWGSLWSLAGQSLLVPPRPQRHFVVVIREVNDMRRSCKKSSTDRNDKKSAVDSKQSISNYTRVGGSSVFHLLIITLGGNLRGSSTANSESQSTHSMSRPKSITFNKRRRVQLFTQKWWG